MLATWRRSTAVRVAEPQAGEEKKGTLFAWETFFSSVKMASADVRQCAEKTRTEKDSSGHDNDSASSFSGSDSSE